MAGSSKPLKLRMGPIRSKLVPDIMKDSWEPEQERTFVKALLHDAAQLDMRNDPQVVLQRLEVLIERLYRVHGRRFHMATMRQKLEQLRKRCHDFGEFKLIPGVKYEPYFFKCRVKEEYWDYIVEEEEPSTYFHFRVNDCATEADLELIFNVHGVAEIPPDPVGSPFSPIELGDGEGGRQMDRFHGHIERQPNFDLADSDVDIGSDNDEGQVLQLPPQQPEVPPPGYRVRANARRGNHRDKLTARMRVSNAAPRFFQGKEVVSEEELSDEDEDPEEENVGGMFGDDLRKMD